MPARKARSHWTGAPASFDRLPLSWHKERFRILQGRLGASFVYPNGAAEAIDWVERILKKSEKPPKKITLGTDEIITANAKAMCEKYDCEAK